MATPRRRDWMRLSVAAKGAPYGGFFCFGVLQGQDTAFARALLPLAIDIQPEDTRLVEGAVRPLFHQQILGHAERGRMQPLGQAKRATFISQGIVTPDGQQLDVPASSTTANTMAAVCTPSVPRIRACVYTEPGLEHQICRHVGHRVGGVGDCVLPASLPASLPAYLE